MLEVGREIDRYVVEAEIGEGGIAHVFRVRHRTLRTLHALKILKVGGRALCERLVQEGQLQAAISHPNIVAVTDVLEVDGSPGLLMEYVEGGALDRWLDTNRPGVAEAERLFRGIVAGVGRAHREGLVHRDLKPGNILLARGDEGLLPKVADFGLAKILMDIPGGANNATRSGVGMGTPAYMSPEQVRNAKGVDQRTDVFALGCILYELLCGRSPFEAPDVLQIFAALSSGRYQPPEEVVPELSMPLRRLIRACLSPEREDRPPDCAAMLAILDDRAGSGASGSLAVPRPPAGLTGASVGLGPASVPMLGARDAVRRSERTPAATFVVPRPFDEGVSGSLVEMPGAKRAASRPSGFTGGDQERAPRVGPAQSVLIGVGILTFCGLVVVLIGLVSVLWYSGARGTAPVAVAPVVAGAPAEPVVSGLEESPPSTPKVEAPAPSARSKPSGAAQPKPAAASAEPAPARVAPKASVPAASESASEPVVAEVEAPPPPEPVVEAPPTGTVTVGGDAERVVLTGPDGTRRKAGANLPIGRYTVQVTFPGSVTINGTIDVEAGHASAIKCVAAMQRCSGWTASN